MIELITLAAATTLAFALGFAIAWAKGGQTREQLAAAEARAEEQAYAAADKLATARRFADLKAATVDADGELDAPQRVDTQPRPLVAPELVARDSAVAQARERAIRVG